MEAKIYRITAGDKAYYGSTTRCLRQRLAEHKCYHKKGIIKCSSFDLFNLDNVKIELIEAFPYTSREQMLMRERYHIENNDCINKMRPIATKEEKTIQQAIYDKKRNSTEHRKNYKRQRYLDQKIKNIYLAELQNYNIM